MQWQDRFRPLNVDLTKIDFCFTDTAVSCTGLRKMLLALGRAKTSDANFY